MYFSPRLTKLFKVSCSFLALSGQHCGRKTHGKASAVERPCVRGSELAPDILVASGRDIRLAILAVVQGPPVSWRERNEVLHTCLKPCGTGYLLLFYPDPRMDNPTLSSPLEQNKITGQLPTFSFLHVCVAMAKWTGLLGLLGVEISWAVYFLWAIYRCFSNYLCVWGFFFVVSAHHFLQVIALNSFAEGDISAGHQPNQAKWWLRDGSRPPLVYFMSVHDLMKWFLIL